MFWQRKLHLILCIFLGISLSTQAQDVKFANTSIDNIRKASKNLDQPYLIYLYDQDSPDCKLMEATTFSQASVVRTLNKHMLPLRIDVASEGGKKLAKRQNIKLFPAILFYDKKGKLLLQQETTIASADFLKILDLLYDIKEENAAPIVETKSKVVAAKVATPPQSVNDDPKNLKKENANPSSNPTVKIPRKTIKVKASEMPELNDKILDKAKKNKLKSPNQLFSAKEKKPKEIIKTKTLNNEMPQLTNQSSVGSDLNLNEYIEFDSETVDYSAPPQIIEATSKPRKNLPRNISSLIASISEERNATNYGLIYLGNSDIQNFSLKSRYNKPAPTRVAYPKPTLTTNVVTKTIIHEKKKSVPVSKPIAVSTQKNKLVQMGAFLKYDDVLRRMYQLNKKVDTDITIIEEVTKGKKMYKLVSADNMSESEANQLVRNLKQKNIDCFIRTSN